MTPLDTVDSLALVLLYASIASLLASVPVWLLLAWTARRWPGVAASRSVWLLAQGVIVAALVLALAPQRSHFSVLPTIEVSRATPVAPTAPPQLADALADEGGSPLAPAEPQWPAWLARAWLGLYIAGLAIAVARQAGGRRVLAALLANARPLGGHELDAHPAFADPATRRLVGPRLPVRETDAPVSPLLAGLVRPCLLLPRHLRSFSPSQQQLIVAHELTHLRRRDPLWLHISIFLQTLLWFNPVLRGLGQRMTWAQELGCDRDVLDGRAQPDRQQYAAALLSQLKLQLPVAGTLAFGDPHQASLGARIRLIRLPSRAGFDKATKAALAVLLCGVLVGSALLQPAFAWRTSAPVASARVAALQQQWRAPLEDARVSSFFGAKRGMSGRHSGIDFVARTGTPVLATADGVVVESTDLYEGGAKYGKVVEVEHPNQLRSLYTHLDQRLVAVGDPVAIGQQIGTSGATGKVTGAHLHLEAFQFGRRIDPARLIGGLDARAFPRALAARAADGTR